MAKHLISFGHGYSKAGAYDSGCTHGGFTEQEMVRRLKPYLKKWADKAGLQMEFYDKNMYADRSVGNYKAYIVTEVHLDAPSGAGGHVIISSQYDPDDIDKRLAAFIAKNFGTVGYVGADGINQRSDLYNLNVCANVGINYRLIELFFLSNDADRNHYINNLDSVAKDFVEALAGISISGQTNTPTPAPTQPATAPTSGLAVGSKVTVRAAATHYQTGQPIASWVKGKTYTIQQVKVVNQSASKRAYLLSDIVSWVLEQDLIPATAQTAKKPTRWINSGSTLHLPGTVSKWRVYRENGPYTVGNEVGYLNPAKFGGLTYEIKGDRMNDVVVIDTQYFGRVAIYVAPNTGATIKQKWIEVEY